MAARSLKNREWMIFPQEAVSSRNAGAGRADSSSSPPRLTHASKPSVAPIAARRRLSSNFYEARRDHRSARAAVAAQMCSVHEVGYRTNIFWFSFFARCSSPSSEFQPKGMEWIIRSNVRKRNVCGIHNILETKPKSSFIHMYHQAASVLFYDAALR